MLPQNWEWKGLGETESEKVWGELIPVGGTNLSEGENGWIYKFQSEPETHIFTLSFTDDCGVAQYLDS